MPPSVLKLPSLPQDFYTHFASSIIVPTLLVKNGIKLDFRNGRPVLRMAVRRRSKSHSRGLSLRPIGCMPALPVTYSVAAAAVAAFGAI